MIRLTQPRPGKQDWLACSLLALAVAGSTPAIAFARTPAQEPARAYQDGGWDTPPGEFREIQRRGFHDGIEGARKDFDNHRAPNVRNREEYRHPSVDASLRDDYREGFRRGYDVAMRHLEGR